MGNSIIVMKDGGDVQGEVLDKVFNFQTGGLGVVSTSKDQIAQINIGLYSGDSPDQMLLTDQSELRGRFLNPNVTIKLSFNNQIKSIPPAFIKTVMFHDNIDS
jgi:hypothetical protein